MSLATDTQRVLAALGSSVQTTTSAPGTSADKKFSLEKVQLALRAVYRMLAAAVSKKGDPEDIASLTVFDDDLNTGAILSAKADVNEGGGLAGAPTTAGNLTKNVLSLVACDVKFASGSYVRARPCPVDLVTTYLRNKTLLEMDGKVYAWAAEGAVLSHTGDKARLWYIPDDVGETTGPQLPEKFSDIAVNLALAELLLFMGNDAGVAASAQHRGLALAGLEVLQLEIPQQGGS